MDFVLQHADRELSPGCFLISCLLKEAIERVFNQSFCRKGSFKDCAPLRSYGQSWCVRADLSSPELRQGRKRDECT